MTDLSAAYKKQTHREHTRQRDMVTRSLLIASNRQDRSEERVRPRRVVAAPVVVTSGHAYVLSVVSERPL
jgi:hypothetical protein